MSKLEQAVVMMRKEAAESAEQKLGRSLVDAERTGIEAVKSMMMLEAICQSFAFEGYSAERIAADVASLAAII